MITEKVLMEGMGYTRQKVSEYVDFVKLEIAVVLLTHMMACMWIHIGREGEEAWVSSFIAE